MIRRLLLALWLLCAFSGPAWAGGAEADTAYAAGDYATAVREWRLAADQGDALAQFNLGDIYERGQGVPQDYVQAVRWYRLAADQGNAQPDYNLVVAQFRLGVMYATGKGVPQDYVQAHMWWNLAGIQGFEMATENRDRLAGRMTPAQIAEAQKLASEWQPK